MLVNVHAVGRVDAEVELIVRPVLCALVTADVVLVDVERHHVLLVLDREAHVADHHAPASQLLSPFELSTRRRKKTKKWTRWSNGGRMGCDKWGVTNGVRQMGCGEWGAADAVWQMRCDKWPVANGARQMGETQKHRQKSGTRV